jgi:hypothetical protein
MDRVTFTTPDRVKYPLPDPAALSFHAACAPVTRLSGAAEYIETVLRDMEDVFILASDESPAHVLSLTNHCQPQPARDGTDNKRYLNKFRYLNQFEGFRSQCEITKAQHPQHLSSRVSAKRLN